MQAMLDIVALWNWNHKLFDKLKLPDSIDKKQFIPSLLIECAELEIRFASHDFMRNAIGWWSARRLPVWQELEKTLQYKYDPIYNYDRSEEISEHTDRGLVHNANTTTSGVSSIKDTASNSDVTTLDLTQKNNGSVDSTVDHTDTGHTSSDTTDTNNTQSTDTTSKIAFNSDALEVAEKQTHTGTDTRTIDVSGDSDNTAKDTTATTTADTQTNTGTSSVAGTNDYTRNATDTGASNTSSEEAEDTAHYHKARMYGNIGVTTTQQLIQEQRELVQFDLQKFIIDDFKQEFCLLVY